MSDWMSAPKNWFIDKFSIVLSGVTHGDINKKKTSHDKVVLIKKRYLDVKREGKRDENEF